MTTDRITKSLKTENIKNHWKISKFTSNKKNELLQSPPRTPPETPRDPQPFPGRPLTPLDLVTPPHNFNDNSHVLLYVPANIQYFTF